jgi:hypothetical protein
MYHHVQLLFENMLLLAILAMGVGKDVFCLARGGGVKNVT